MKRKHPLGAENLQLDDELDRKSLYSLCMHQESKIKKSRKSGNPSGIRKSNRKSNRSETQWKPESGIRNPGIPIPESRQGISHGNQDFLSSTQTPGGTRLDSLAEPARRGGVRSKRMHSLVPSSMEFRSSSGSRISGVPTCLPPLSAR